MLTFGSKMLKASFITMRSCKQLEKILVSVNTLNLDSLRNQLGYQRLVEKTKVKHTVNTNTIHTSYEILLSGIL